MLIDKMTQLGPEFFDIFGLLAFIYVIFIAHLLLEKKRLSKGFIILLLLVGLGGFLVDLLFVSSTYLLR